MPLISRLDEYDMEVKVKKEHGGEISHFEWRLRTGFNQGSTHNQDYQQEPLSTSSSEQWERRMSTSSGPPHYPPQALPPIQVKATFGLLGEAGVIVNILLYIIDIVTDVLLLAALKNQVITFVSILLPKGSFIWHLLCLYRPTQSLIIIKSSKKNTGFT